MTYQQIINETKKLKREEFFKYLQKLSVIARKYFNWEVTIRIEEKKETSRTRNWKNKGKVDLKSKLDDVNIRDLAYGK
ncbi:MAG: hypothetical protein GXO47_08305 [Chlorobi bacterium]|nr:hypothetical protein [Chlorobiota bacterium]